MRNRLVNRVAKQGGEATV